MDVKSALILIGGPDKGTRFRPLSLSLPKMLFPIASKPIISHLIDQLVKIPSIQEFVLVGSYDHDDCITEFLIKCTQQYKWINFRYVQEKDIHGTAAAVYCAKNLFSESSHIIILNGDVAGRLDLNDIINPKEKGNDAVVHIITSTVADYQSHNFGCVVYEQGTNNISHFIEKPKTFVSSEISTGVYIMSREILSTIEKFILEDAKKNAQEYEAYNRCQNISLEKHILPILVGENKVKGRHTDNFWVPIKDPSSALYANAFYLSEMPNKIDEKRYDNVTFSGNVFIDKSCKIGKYSKIGPNVSLGKNVIIGNGVRIKNSIVLPEARIDKYCLISNSIIGWNCIIKQRCRIEGTHSNPNPDKEHSTITLKSLFTEGVLNPCATVLGNSVSLSEGNFIRDSIILPYKSLFKSCINELIL